MFLKCSGRYLQVKLTELIEKDPVCILKNEFAEFGYSKIWVIRSTK